MSVAKRFAMRFAKRKFKAAPLGRGSRLKVGFVPTIDCATLIAAEELGLFRSYGLSVRLSREIGWATIREKILHEELDAAAAHASMLFSIYCGLGGLRRPCLTGLMMNSNGSAITLSNALWDQGVRNAPSLGVVVRQKKVGRQLIFGVVLQYSSQHYNLQKWLASGGVQASQDVQIVVIPSGLIYESFRQGFIDGYCVAEPWNSLAVLNKTGWVCATSAEVTPEHPEKVLLVLQDFADERDEEHVRLIAALIESSQFCERPENRRELAAMLSKPAYLDVDAKFLCNSLVGPFQAGRELLPRKNIVAYDAVAGGAPDRKRAKWVFELMQTLGSPEARAAIHPDVMGRVFRKDIFERALRLYRSKNLPNLGPAPVSAITVPANASPREQGRRSEFIDSSETSDSWIDFVPPTLVPVPT